jgi:hypothetical protein
MEQDRKDYLVAAILFISLAVIILFTSGCMTRTQLEAEQSYYQAMVSMQKQQAAQPLFQLIASDKDKPMILQNVASFTVFAPPQGENGPRLQQYTQTNYALPWINLFTQTVGIAAPWVGAAVIATNVASSFKDVAVHSQPGNTTNITAGGNAMTGGTMTQTTSTATTMSNTVSGTRNTGTLSGVVNQTTSTPPLIVTQPAPVIVTQPAPIVVTQPPPVVVNPSYPPK